MLNEADLKLALKLIDERITDPKKCSFTPQRELDQLFATRDHVASELNRVQAGRVVDR